MAGTMIDLRPLPGAGAETEPSSSCLGCKSAFSGITRSLAVCLGATINVSIYWTSSVSIPHHDSLSSMLALTAAYSSAGEHYLHPTAAFGRRSSARRIPIAELAGAAVDVAGRSFNSRS